MEPFRGIGGRKALLPYEVEICNTLQITDKEYFEFVEVVSAYAKNRDKAYDLIPDIRCDPGTLALTATTATGATTLTALGQIVVGIALSAISYLLTPKPKELEQGPQITVGGVQGRSRFAPQSDFDSVQELAVLGSFIPLVYAKKGVRVNSQLLWSHIKTTGLGEILSVVALFSHGELGDKPVFDSFAVGDSFLENFSARKLALYFRNGNQQDIENRITASDKYVQTTAPETTNLRNRGNEEFDPQDPFSVKIEPNQDPSQFRYSTSNSSVKSSFTQSKFGVYSPMPNGNAYRVNWELILFGLDADDDLKENHYPHKIRKILNKYPRYCSVISGVHSAGTRITANKGDRFKYEIFGSSREDAFIEQSLESEGLRLYGDATFYTRREKLKLFQREASSNQQTRKHNKFSPYGSEDAKSVIDTVRNQTDDNIQVGQQYLMGTALVTCVTELDGRQWSPEKEFGKQYEFEVDEKGIIEIQNKDAIKAPFETFNLQRVSLASASNTKACHITEIGIKSQVFRKINGFPNLNAVPSAEVILNTEDKNGSISVGGMSKFVTRLSFFKLQIKPKGSIFEFKDVWPDGILCIKGDSPVDQYNTITCQLGLGDKQQLEFRLFPVPGNFVLSKENPNRRIFVLKHAGAIYQKTFTEFSNTNITISIHAEPFTLPTIQQIPLGTSVTNNREWKRYNEDFQDSATSAGGPITSLDRFNNSNEGHVNPLTLGYNYTFEDITDPAYPGENTANDVFNSARGLAVIFNKTPTRWEYIYYTGGITNIYISSKPAGIEPDRVFTSVGLRDGVMRRVEIGTKRSGSGTSELYGVTIKKANSTNVVETTTLVTPSSSVGSGAELLVKSYPNSSYKEWQITKPGTGYKISTVLTFNIGGSTSVVVNGIQNEEQGVSSSLAERLQGLETNRNKNYRLQKPYFEETNYNPNNKIADYFLYDEESSSHENGPEHEIVFLNEVLDSKDSDAITKIPYTKLAICGLRVNSSKEFESFNQLSAFISKGIKVIPLTSNNEPHNAVNTTTKESSDNFPEIAFDLLTNEEYGAAKTIGVSSVDKGRMAIASAYCKANKFHWNGVIDKKFSLREFIFEHAANNLCDFNILGGQFSLTPSFPVDSTNKIKFDAVMGKESLPIKALFTDGNIKNIQVSFLSPEERQMFKAVMIYRKDTENGFSENEVEIIGYREINPNNSSERLFADETLPEEVFDFSNWCTSKEHVKLFAAIALATRRLVDHAITFETSPTSVINLIPGEYIRLISEATHTNRFNNGTITANGKVVAREKLANVTNKDIFFWSPGTAEVKEGKITTNSEGFVTSGPTNVLFTEKVTETSDRIYKIESITYAEDGFVKVAATHVPLTTNGTLAVLERTDPSKVSYTDIYEVMD